MTADLEKLLKRIIHIRRTPSELAGISSEMRAIFDDLFEDGSYKLIVLPDKDTLDGIYIWLDARLNGCKIQASCVFSVVVDGCEELDTPVLVDHPRYDDRGKSIPRHSMVISNICEGDKKRYD